MRLSRVSQLAMLVLSSIAVEAGVAAEPPAAPLLRIEPGMHTLRIGRISVDQQERSIATSSVDNTVRLWDLSSGELIRVYRPPLGSVLGGRSSLVPVGISPRGDWIATGGATGTEWDDGQSSIYLFNRSTGSLDKRLTFGKGGVFSLAWSADGSYLAAVGFSGLRVYRTRDFALIGNIEYEPRTITFSVDIHPNGKLVTTRSGGAIALYQLSPAGLDRLSEVRVDVNPRAARFSPDGTRIAIVSSESTVDIRSTNRLSLLGTLDVSSLVSNERPVDLAIAWAKDGSIYVGGSARRVSSSESATFVRIWKPFEKGAYRDVSTGQRHDIVDLRPLSGGRFAFATEQPAWGVLDQSGNRIRWAVARSVEIERGNPAGLLVSADGSAVAYVDQARRELFRFDISQRSLLSGKSGDERFTRPETSAPGLLLTGWEDNSDLKNKVVRLNGKELRKHMYVESLAVSPRGDGFVLAHPLGFYRYDQQGANVWSRTARAPRAINITRDGRALVAATGDGSIRWYRYSDGEEFLALFLHSDGKSWVLWTPSGYYDASPGAEELIGWHANRGKDKAADFFPASRFRNHFYRPDVIARILATQNEGEAVRLANLDAGRRAELQPLKIGNVVPPVVEILAPGSETTVKSPSVAVRYATRAPSDAPVIGIRARVNGQVVDLGDTRNLVVAAGDTTKEIVIPIPPQDSVIQLFAENKNGFSTPAIVRVNWAGQAASTNAEALLKPKLYVLAVGVSKYANPAFNLGLAAKDARDFAALLDIQRGKLYGEVSIRLLTDEKATKDEILDGLEWLKREVTARDVGILLLAGHGVNDNTGNYYFLPHNGDPDRLLRTGVAQNDIKITLNSLAGKALFFVDTCHSGNALGTAKTRSLGPDVNAFVNELTSAENGVVVFAASTGRQVSMEKPEWGNGAFTKAVVEGLSGKADFQNSGRITHKGLDYYVAERVKELTGGRQSPVSISPAGISDFPIASLR